MLLYFYTHYRCRVITLEALSVKNIRKILQRALKKLKIGIELSESENEEESSTDEESEEEEEEPDEQEEENADTQEVTENRSAVLVDCLLVNI